MIGRTAGNALYDWTNRPAGTVTKSYDGLNRDAGLASLGDGYDLNGNVTHDARQLYGYDIENRLVSVADAATSAPLLSLAYDPLGRLRSQTASGVTTQFLYDGDRLAAEYNSGGTLTARYVHGAGVDEPLAWYGDSGVGLRRASLREASFGQRGSGRSSCHCANLRRHALTAMVNRGGATQANPHAASDRARSCAVAPVGPRDRRCAAPRG